MACRWSRTAWSCTRWETAPAWCPSASWWRLRSLSLTTLTITKPQPHFTRVASLTVRQSLTDKLSLYFHTTHGSFVTFVYKGSNYIIWTTRMDVAFNHGDGKTKVLNVEWKRKLCEKHKLLLSLELRRLDMHQLTGSEFRVTETKTYNLLAAENSLDYLWRQSFWKCICVRARANTEEG